MIVILNMKIYSIFIINFKELITLHIVI